MGAPLGGGRVDGSRECRVAVFKLVRGRGGRIAGGVRKEVLWIELYESTVYTERMFEMPLYQMLMIVNFKYALK